MSEEQAAPRNYALLTIGELRLSLPQHEVLSVEVIADIVAPEANGHINEVARLPKDGSEWPVSALSNTLELLKEVPQQRRFCLCIMHQQGSPYALACDGVEVLKLSDSDIPEQLSEMMTSSITPVHKLLMHGEDLVLLTTAQSLGNYIDTLGEINE